MAPQPAFPRFAQVLQQMPAVGDRDGVGSAFAGALNGLRAPITADDFDLGMLSQPGGQSGCCTIGQQIDRSMGQRTSVDEAMAHVQRALETGLVPLVVHASFDAWMLGIPYRRTLAVCVCCDCCCTVRQSLRLGPPAFWDTVVRLPGITVTVDLECTGCGLCTDVCPTGAISLNGSVAQISDSCKGCGRCATVCPTEAITLRVAENVDVLDRLMVRIERRTDIGLEGEWGYRQK